MFIYVFAFLLFIVLIPSFFSFWLIRLEFDCKKKFFLIVPLLAGVIVIVVHYSQLVLVKHANLDYVILKVIIEDGIKLIFATIFIKVYEAKVEERGKFFNALVMIALGVSLGFAFIENILFFIKKINSLNILFVFTRAIIPSSLHVILSFSYIFALYSDKEKHFAKLHTIFKIILTLALHYSFNLIFYIDKTSNYSKLYGISPVLYYLNLIVFIVLLINALFLIVKRLLSSQESVISFDTLTNRNRRK